MVDSSREGVGSACEGEVVEPVTVARGSVWVLIFSSICVHFCIPYATTIRIWNTPYPVMICLSQWIVLYLREMVQVSLHF